MQTRSHGYSSRVGIYFREDIGNALRAVDVANECMYRAIDVPEIVMYRHGFEAALRAVAEAFGLRQYELPNLSATESQTTIDILPY